MGLQETECIMRPSVLFVVYLVINFIALEGFLQGQASDDTSHVDHAISRFLSQSPAYNTGCTANPNVCRLRGSTGLNCCRNACVSIYSHGQNCGRCGHKCKHQEACCGGVCVDLFHNKNHCGRCYNGCKKEDTCPYGMCNYA
ncbi:Stigma-specific STIG1-like protein 3 [Nymphaea thermarum]|nr:Stigma-specific STIG1-like protein 3 [Nymphaea thermarum]